MFVTFHAKQRFALHINAVVDPVHGVCKMWHTGRPAEDWELAEYDVHRHEEHEYRIGSFEGSTAVLVARGNYIKTLLPAFRVIKGTPYTDWAANHKR